MKSTLKSNVVSDRIVVLRKSNPLVQEKANEEEEERWSRSSANCKEDQRSRELGRE